MCLQVRSEATDSSSLKNPRFVCCSDRAALDLESPQKQRSWISLFPCLHTEVCANSGETLAELAIFFGSIQSQSSRAETDCIQPIVLYCCGVFSSSLVTARSLSSAGLSRIIPSRDYRAVLHVAVWWSRGFSYRIIIHVAVPRLFVRNFVQKGTS